MTGPEIFSSFISNHPDFLKLPAEEQSRMADFFGELPYMHIRNIGDHLVDGVFICDLNGKILYVNDVNARLTGIPAEDCIGHNISEFLQEEGISNVVARHVLQSGQAYTSIAVSPISKVQMLEVGSPIMAKDGSVIGVVIIDRDISELSRMTNALKDSEEKLANYEKVTSRNNLVIRQLTQQHIQEQMRFSSILEPRSESMREVFRMAGQAASTDVTVLLTGETGTGKEVIANYIYENSPRKGRPFIKVNCAAIPEHLVESELFGYVEGAFTGANAQGKIGMFELANTGTIFLDEIGELPLEFQAKLLRAIQQREITRIGATEPVKINVRIIAATNRDLEQMIEEKTFRSDLFYRLNIFPIKIPPLRERKEDIVPLTQHFLKVHNRKYNKNIMITDDALLYMSAYEWPGNIRELENLLERWVVVFDDFSIITWEMVSGYFPGMKKSEPAEPYAGKTLKELLQEKERDILQWAVDRYGTSREIARALKVDHSTIVRKAKAHGIRLQQTDAQQDQNER